MIDLLRRILFVLKILCIFYPSIPLITFTCGFMLFYEWIKAENEVHDFNIDA